MASGAPKSTATEKTAVISISHLLFKNNLLNNLAFEVDHNSNHRRENDNDTNPTGDAPVVHSASRLFVQSS